MSVLANAFKQFFAHFGFSLKRCSPVFVTNAFAANKVLKTGVCVVGATGIVNSDLVVPENETWLLHGLSGWLGSGTYTMCALGVNRSKAVTSYYPAVGKTFTTLAAELNEPLKMTAGDLVVAICDGFTGSGNFYVSAIS